MPAANIKIISSKQQGLDIITKESQLGPHAAAFGTKAVVVWGKQVFMEGPTADSTQNSLAMLLKHTESILDSCIELLDGIAETDKVQLAGYTVDRKLLTSGAEEASKSL